ncbi:EamA family transporter [Microbacterium mangrovi]|uniref:EamA family transporter n=1 Tax=Microbacterium mangrovi TaxID=1348253 RepID=UPI00068E96E4|nr:EamA family transporter [Microbacterium mangrovi]
MSSSSRSPIAVLMVIGSCTSLQFGAAIATPLMAHFGPGLVTWLRLLFAGLLLLAVHRPRVRAWTRRQWFAVVVFGLTLAGMNGFFYASIARIPLGIAVTIEFAGPLVLAAVLSRRPLDFVCVGAAGIAIAYLGLDGVSTGAGLDPLGILFALIAAAFWAAYILAGKHVGERVPGQGALPIGMLVGSFIVLPFGVGQLPALAADPVKLLPLLGMAVLSSLVPYSLEFAAMQRLTPRVFGVLLSLEPVIAGVAGFLLLGQGLTWPHVAAMLVVTAASAVSVLTQKPQPGRDTGTPEVSPERETLPV